MKNKYFLFSALLLLFTCTYSESYNSQNRLVGLFGTYHKPFVNQVYSPKNSQVLLDSKVHATLICPTLKVLSPFFDIIIGANVLEFAFTEIRQSNNNTSEPINLIILQKRTRRSVLTGDPKNECVAVTGKSNISLRGTKLFESTKISLDVVYVIAERIISDNQLIYYI